jgi:hypothetical protein
MNAMTVLGQGLTAAYNHEDALSVQEAELSILRRLGASGLFFAAQTNLANTYHALGRNEEALRIRRDVYSGRLKLFGEEHRDTLTAASNYGTSFRLLNRFEEAKALFRKTMPVARRVLGESDQLTLKMRWVYAMALYLDSGATLDDLREAVTTLEDTVRVARRVLGAAHPLTAGIEVDLKGSRAELRELK